MSFIYCLVCARLRLLFSGIQDLCILNPLLDNNIIIQLGERENEVNNEYKITREKRQRCQTKYCLFIMNNERIAIFAPWNTRHT